ncbi:hypothetical protein [Maridesulfovibrio sp.]|uniref:hypothetical protein n=1 Tax=Maridesulfovibrio sp. TaxID=2795000 RepID=UPI002AA6F5E3|nr:hypothetical protein [Maridesulfovibrio sp.]
MIYSYKSLTVAAMLFISSILIIAAMHLPIFNGADGFEAMESSFNSLRKGVKPPFKQIARENTENLGKNINITLVFRTDEEARAVTMMFLRNKLTVTPKERRINIQGDLGYTLKFFMNDIHLLYMHNFSELQQRYSMPPTLSMYYLNHILQKMAVAMASQKKEPQEKLIKKIRNKLLIPAYNLREALPVNQTSGFTYLALGTLGILIFAILWDISNFLFFGTLASEDFMKSIRIRLGRELSGEEKKRLAVRKKKMAKAMAERKKKMEKLEKVKSTRTNKEALKKKATSPKSDPATAKKKAVEKRKKAATDPAKPRRKNVAPTSRTQPEEVVSGREAQSSDALTSKKKVTKKKAGKQVATSKKKSTKPADKKPARPVEKEAATPRKQPMATENTGKKVKKSTSQTQSKKVTTQQGRKKSAAISKPEAAKKKVGKTKPTAEPMKNRPGKKPQTAPKEIKPDEQ